MEALVSFKLSIIRNEFYTALGKLRRRKRVQIIGSTYQIRANLLLHSRLDYKSSGFDGLFKFQLGMQFFLRIAILSRI